MTTYLCSYPRIIRPVNALDSNGWELAQFKLEHDALKRRVEALEQERNDLSRFDDDGGSNV